MKHPAGTCGVFVPRAESEPRHRTLTWNPSRTLRRNVARAVMTCLPDEEQEAWLPRLSGPVAPLFESVEIHSRHPSEFKGGDRDARTCIHRPLRCWEALDDST